MTPTYTPQVDKALNCYFIWYSHKAGFCGEVF